MCVLRLCLLCHLTSSKNGSVQNYFLQLLLYTGQWMYKQERWAKKTKHKKRKKKKNMKNEMYFHIAFFQISHDIVEILNKIMEFVSPQKTSDMWPQTHLIFATC